MRAFVVTAPHEGAVRDVVAPVATPGQVVVDVHRAGICGTDVEFFTGDMTYLQQGHAEYPMRLGHEWSGVVSAVASSGDEDWLGKEVTGDTMLGCGVCRLCVSGRQHVCLARHEIGIRAGWPGALAEQLLVPVGALHSLPSSVDHVAGAMVEPGGNALRAVQSTSVAAGSHLLIYGTGTIGLLAAMFARSADLDVHLVAADESRRRAACDLGFDNVTVGSAIPEHPYDAVIDATFDSSVPAQALTRVQPGGRLVLIGLSGEPSWIDTRDLVLADVTAVGILSGSPGLAGAIEHYADARVDPRPLVRATVALDEIAAVLGGQDPVGRGPKVHVDPRR